MNDHGLGALWKWISDLLGFDLKLAVRETFSEVFSVEDSLVLEETESKSYKNQQRPTQQTPKCRWTPILVLFIAGFAVFILFTQGGEEEEGGRGV